MHIKVIHLREFKRFTNLRIEELPSTTKLIVLAGPNGNGKSSLFDAFWEVHHRMHSGLGITWQSDYYEKKLESPQTPAKQNRPIIEFHESSTAGKKSFYIRSAYRNEADFRTSNLERTPSDLDRRRFERLIDNDTSVSHNYRRIASFAVDELYKGDAEKTYGQFREETSGEINKYLNRLFPNLSLTDLGRPLESGTFFFTKGNSKNFPYKNLSGGEKAVFDILLDIVVNRKDFDNTIYAIDEPESHVNPRLHADFLKVLFEIIPPNCQLWLATHAIGMLRAARDIAIGDSNAVVFLDFDKDFDQPQVLRPEPFDRNFWERSLETAFADMAALVAPKMIIRCEGEHRKQGDGFDSQVYETIFGAEYPDVRFVSSGAANDIKKDIALVTAALEGKIPGLVFEKLMDRDDMTEAERDKAKADGIRVLKRRHLESYLFDDEILKALAEKAGKPELTENVIAARDNALASAVNRGRPQDDMKAAAGEAYVEVKKLLGLTQAGSNAEAFMRDTLASLVQPSTVVYQELKQEIFTAA